MSRHMVSIDRNPPDRLRAAAIKPLVNNINRDFIKASKNASFLFRKKRQYMTTILDNPRRMFM